MRNIVLIGFMGTGKSTVASLLAERLGYDKVDLDTAIEQAAGVSIPQLFAERGEPYFRQLETDTLKRQLEGLTGRIIATGGGAVLAEENRRLMLEHSIVIALVADAETIISRVQNDPNRPLLKGNAQQSVPELLEKRKHAYDFGHMKIDTSNRTAEQIADLIAETMKKPI